MTVRFRIEAFSDVLEARDWYESRRQGLGDEFVQALEQGIKAITDLPEAFPAIDMGLRRALLHRFPYAVYYLVDSEGIQILACLHNRRSPSRWRDRL